MNCENKRIILQLLYYNSTRRETKTWSGGGGGKFCFCFLFEPKFLVSSALFCASSIPPLLFSQSLHLLPLSFPLFSSNGDLDGVPPVFVQTQSRTLRFFPPSSLSFPLCLSFCCLPLFSLASSVRLPRDSRLLCSRYRPIDFGKGRGKYSGHDSPCMNLMIPVFICTFPSMAVEEEQINRTPSFFLSPSLQACQ